MRLGLGWYFLDTKPYGRGHRNLAAVRPYTTFTFVEAETRNADGKLDWWMHGSEEGFVKAMNLARNRGFKLHLNFQDSYPGHVVRLAAPFWDVVELVDIEDEPELSKFDVHRKCSDIKAAITDAGLPLRPVGAVFAIGQIRHGTGWHAKGLDWIGIEGYVESAHQSTIKTATAECRRLLREQLDVLPEKPIVVVAKAFAGKAGAWTNIPALAALSTETYRVARPDPRVTHIRFFNYGRKDGALHHKSVAAAVKAIAKQEAA